MFIDREEVNFMRVTLHNARLGGGRHNDRDFDLSKANHIDAEKSNNNYYVHALTTEEPNLSFAEAEVKIYERAFGGFINDKNARAIAARHPERCVTAEELVKSERYRPEEVIFQLGDKDNHVSEKQLTDVFNEFLKWHNEKFNKHIFTLDVAVHVDEQTPHIHWRRVWSYDDDKGFKAIGQHKALEQLGFKLPDESKQRSRSNNLKMAYTEVCRNKVLEICKERQIEIVAEPERRAPNEQNLAKGDFIIAKQDAEIQRQREFSVELDNSINDLQHTNNELQEQLKLTTQDMLQSQEQLKSQLQQLQQVNDDLEAAEKTIKAKDNAIRELDQAKAQLKLLNDVPEQKHKHIGELYLVDKATVMRAAVTTQSLDKATQLDEREQQLNERAQQLDDKEQQLDKRKVELENSYNERVQQKLRTIDADKDVKIVKLQAELDKYIKAFGPDELARRTQQKTKQYEHERHDERER